MLANVPTWICNGRVPDTMGACRFTCINPSSCGVMPARLTAAGAPPIVAVVVRVSFDNGDKGNAAAVGIA